MCSINLDFFGKAKKILKSDNPFEILEQNLQAKQSSQGKRDVVEWDPQDFGMGEIQLVSVYMV